MRLRDSHWVPATPEQTWQALHDPAVLQRCIGGCQRVERLADTEYAVCLTARVAGSEHRFNGEILLSDETPPYRATVAFEGTGEHAGLAIGHADVTLEAAPHGGTRVCYDLHAATGGELGRLGQAPLEHIGQKLVDGFFMNFVDHMAHHPPVPEAGTPQPGGRAAAAHAWQGTAASWLMLGATVAVLAVYYSVFK